MPSSIYSTADRHSWCRLVARHTGATSRLAVQQRGTDGYRRADYILNLIVDQMFELACTTRDESLTDKALAWFEAHGLVEPAK